MREYRCGCVVISILGERGSGGICHMVNELEWTGQHAGKLAVNIQEISWTIHYSVDIFFPQPVLLFVSRGLLINH